MQSLNILPPVVLSMCLSDKFLQHPLHHLHLYCTVTTTPGLNSPCSLRCSLRTPKAGLNPGYGVRTASTPCHQDGFQWSPYSSLKELEGCVVPSTLSIREGEAMRRCRCCVDELVLVLADSLYKYLFNFWFPI